MAIQFKYEISKEISDKSLDAIEIARKSGKLKKGANEVTKCAERSSAKLVVVASDTQPEEVVMHLPILCEEKNIPCIGVDSKTELGAAAGLSVPCAAIAITEEGNSKKLISEIASKTTGITVKTSETPKKEPKKEEKPKEETTKEKAPEEKKEEKPAEEKKK
jgi:large subunit ribosomal protein L7Ae